MFPQSGSQSVKRLNYFEELLKNSRAILSAFDILLFIPYLFRIARILWFQIRVVQHFLFTERQQQMF